MALEQPGSGDRLRVILRNYEQFRRHVVPLCAAETPISPYVRSFLASTIHEQYAMGGPVVPAGDNFVGAQHVLDLHQLVIDLCREVYGVNYADPRPLSGTHAVTTLLMTLSEPGQRVLLQTASSGGHASMLPICRRLGLEVVDLPYNFEEFQIDFDEVDKMDLSSIDFVLYAPSDILYAPDPHFARFDARTTVIYDATQTLGLIASGHLPSPFAEHPRMVVSGGTHKTLPGPSSGLLLTSNDEIAAQLDAELSPRFVRHSHPHHMAALCATLIEQRAIGLEYSARIRQFAQVMSAQLAAAGLSVLAAPDRPTETHQIFLGVASQDVDAAYGRAAGAGVTLNKKHKRLFRGAGIRLGVQAIARYRWGAPELAQCADLIRAIVRNDEPASALRDRAITLAAHNSFEPSVCLDSAA